MWLVVTVIVAAAAAIGIAEFIDAKDVKLQYRIMRDVIRTTGTVTSVERRAVFEKSRYRWETSVIFDYEGRTYTIEQKCITKPLLQKGDKITVCICKNDPWKSCIAVTEQ